MNWLRLFIVLALSYTTLASPITRRQSLPVLESSELAILKTHAKYASAAYCPQEKLTNWTCGERCVGKLNVTTYFSSGASGIAGYIGYSKEDKKIVISFRGSSNLANWIKNLGVTPTAFVYPTANDKVKVHSGFYETYASVESTVRAGLKQVLTTLKDQTESYKLVITGHSLGGAVAAFCAMDIKRFYLNPMSGRSFQSDLLIIDRSQIYLHTYGQPRTGNKEFAQLVYDTFGLNSTQSRLTRITNKNDPVSRLPPQNLDYFQHPHEVYIRKDGNTVVCTDVVNGKVAEDQNCIVGVAIPLGFSAHTQFWDIKLGSGC
ncbi:alpha/beta-hydrolase [Basidiobolus meristosporus CBS 931.73]|uniref:Alpha/beta-hydrolase n=1 Tax=Basidiobolus meristosporus CBS 931.73 TaxID=1314790 RepID=A0A1Y1Y833_9FUNG|nr:alpha/beta-hydrolase [Basidiobolus meristosporus CBS 931.73]|eukprot:ORX94177.1 alpha/beta-hydrolase [Basidiobolus meristosporus CBS 931.73]